MRRAVIYTDGACSGNPGPSGIGVAITFEGRTIEIAEYIGIATNNIAEYSALIRALKEAISLGVEEVHAHMDSELAVKQINGIYKVKNAGIKPLHKEATMLLRAFKKHTLVHVPREQNKLADKLSKMGTDPACAPQADSPGSQASSSPGTPDTPPAPTPRQPEKTPAKVSSKNPSNTPKPKHHLKSGTSGAGNEPGPDKSGPQGSLPF